MRWASAVVAVSLSLLAPSVAHAEPEATATEKPSARGKVVMIVGASVAGVGTITFGYGFVRWLAGAIAPDNGRWLDLVGGHCQSGSESERQACDREEAEDFRERKATNDGNRRAGGTAMIVGVSVLAAGALVAAVGYGMRKADVENAANRPATVRILPVEQPVRWVPPPDKNTTVIVPVIGGTW